MSGHLQHRVDAIIPTRNRAALTVEAVRSVQAQTFTRWHCYVVDDASDDDTPDAAERLAQDDPRITVIRRTTHGGANPARQTGLEASSAPLVALCDSDDLWEPQKLDRQVAFWDRARASGQPVDVVLCWHDAVMLDGTRRGPVLRPSRRRRWHPFTQFNTSTPLVTRAALETVGGFAHEEPYPAQTTDHVDLYLRLLEHHRSATVPELLVHCRHHPGARNSDAQGTRAAADEAAALLDAWDERLAHQPQTLAWLRGWVAGRYLELGDLSRAVPYLGAAMRADKLRTSTRIAAHYAPLVVHGVTHRTSRR